MRGVAGAALIAATFHPTLHHAVKRIAYPAAIQGLIGELKRLPGIGPRSAERIALWMLQSRDARPLEIARAIRDLVDE